MVGAISTGSFILADAGLSTNRRCTVHWEYADLFRSRYPELKVSRDLYIVDRDVFTCSGGTAALDMMLHFVSEASTPQIAVAVAEQFIHPRYSQAGGSSAPRDRIARYGVDSAILVEIIKLMEGSLENPLDIRQMAERVGVSARQVERLFRLQIGTSPKAFYSKLRLARARTLLRQTIDPILAIAVECGFGSTSHFSHAYKRLFGIAPTDERRGGAKGDSSRGSRRRLPAEPGRPRSLWSHFTG